MAHVKDRPTRIVMVARCDGRNALAVLEALIACGNRGRT